ncbi:MAG: glutaredoxin 3 [endosymbiont of Galathealinum brachiosum]|uniref:Glutaredoxin n=1 Tax=endosymbiont of Galathealinum brachiosum TaxID=2200906 RepID=A0A370DKI5_9GAMM|nr:MAG: glutaredoxin 3 [endosymbiont of Galathealinum brachiosum]
MNKVRMYRTRSCPYCRRAEKLLKKHGVKKMHVIDVAGNKKLWAAMEKETRRNTVPQIFIGDVHVGGYDDLAALDRKGKLDKLLKS